MKLTEDRLPAFLDLVYPDLPGEERGRRRARWAERLAGGEDPLRRPHVVVEGGAVTAAMWLFQPETGRWWVSMPRLAAGADPSPLVGELAALARAHGVSRLKTRQDVRQLTPALRAALAAAGFEAFNRRVEYKQPVETLPAEGPDSPFSWVPHTALSLEAVGDVIDRAGAGPEWEEGDSGLSLARAWLSEGGMSSGPEALQVGFIGGRAAAFVAAQVEAGTGWATLTFLGLLPELRGRGLGGFVHRRGFDLLRAQGGAVYHGGTSASNAAMRALFERHGCRLYLELEELAADL
jgi:ribosomal protein S18 acetylase RimI-like enzyme